MTDLELLEVIESADFIVSGYVFTKREDGNISILAIDEPHHAAIIDQDGEVLETNMYDIELDIVLHKYWANNRKQLFDQRYA